MQNNKVSSKPSENKNKYYFLKRSKNNITCTVVERALCCRKQDCTLISMDMKRIVRICLAGLALLAFVSCSEKKTPEPGLTAFGFYAAENPSLPSARESQVRHTVTSQRRHSERITSRSWAVKSVKPSR